MKQIIILLTMTCLFFFSKEDSVDEFTKKCIDAGKDGTDDLEKGACQEIDLDYDLKCCFVQYTLNGIYDTKFCAPIYDSLSSIKGYAKMFRDAKKVKVLCHSNFLTFNFLISFFVLLFLI